MTDFASRLRVNMSNFSRPRPLPDGSFTWQCTNFEVSEIKPMKGKHAGKDCLVVTIFSSPRTPGDDVPLAALNEIENWNEREVRTQIWLYENFATDGSGVRLMEFLEKLGINTKDREVPDALGEVPGKLFKAHNKARPDQNNPEIRYDEIDMSTVVRA